MPRAAGDSRDYEIAVVDGKGNAREILGGFPSVTTVIGDADAAGGIKDAMAGWGYNLGVAGMMQLLDAGRVKPGDDVREVKKRLTRIGAPPWLTKDKRAESGTNVHDLAERLLLNKIDYDDVLESLPVEEQGYGKALIAWHKTYDAKSIVYSVERTLVSLDHQYSGTADLIDQDKSWSKDECRVVDYKTSKAVRDSHRIQGTAYALAWQEMSSRLGSPMQVREVSVVRFGEDGQFEEHVEPYNGADVFLAMRALYRARNGY